MVTVMATVMVTVMVVVIGLGEGKDYYCLV
jgi:hypothetical protein